MGESMLCPVAANNTTQAHFKSHCIVQENRQRAPSALLSFAKPRFCCLKIYPEVIFQKTRELAVITESTDEDAHVCDGYGLSRIEATPRAIRLDAVMGRALR